MSDPRIVVVPDAAALADEVSGRIERAASEVPPDARFRLALSGGHTPRATYERLARRDAPWSRFELYFGDERLVPPDDPASNFHMAREALIERSPLAERQVHRIPGELPPEAKRFIEIVEEQVGVPVKVVGVGAERDDYLVWAS